jgi:hypothetical protein
VTVSVAAVRVDVLVRPGVDDVISEEDPSWKA